MNAKQILTQAVIIGQYLLGEKAERRKFIMRINENQTTEQVLILPVTPNKYEIQSAQINKTVEILDTGEALLFGNTKLKRLKFSCFFPAQFHEYPFVVGDNRDPEECVDLLTKWKESKIPIRIIITDSPVNLKMAIMSFNWQERDGTRDIYYDLDLTEYRDLNTPTANNTQQVLSLTGLRERKNTDQNIIQQQRFVNNAGDIYESAKYAYGNFAGLDKFKSINNVKSLTRNVGKSWKW